MIQLQIMLALVDEYKWISPLQTFTRFQSVGSGASTDNPEAMSKHRLQIPAFLAVIWLNSENLRHIW